MNKKISKFLLAALAAGAVQTACAFNYTDGHLILVCRGGTGANDVEYDLGSVSNYVGLAAGTQITSFPNFDTTVLSNNFNNQLNGVKFCLFATTPPGDPWSRVWATDTSLLTATPQLAFSPWSSLRGQMSSVGIAATQNTTSNATPNYVVSAGTSGAYDYIASGGNLAQSVTTWNGLLTTPTEGTIPGTLTFYQIEPSPTTPKPPATFVGSFILDANGKLTYTAGMVVSSDSKSKITKITRAGTSVNVSFTTSLGAIHRLRYLTSIGGSWTTLSTPATGDGTVKTLQDTTTDPVRFYEVVTSTN